MIATKVQLLAALYETDETAWLEAMARLASQRLGSELDFEHLAEFLADMAKRDRREVESRLAVLIAHLLKWEHQPAKRTRGWLLTIEQQRQELRRLLSSSTLSNHAEKVLNEVYADGLSQSAIDTGLPASAFPADSPFTLTQLDQQPVEGELPDQ